MMENGTSAEMDVAGNEGLVGIALFMKGYSAPNRAVVHILDRNGLEATVCERYRVVKDEYDRLLA